jgi:hypothetical protein
VLPCVLTWQGSFVFIFAFIFGSARLLESNSDGLAAAPDLAALAATSALEFAVLKLVHDAAGGLSLAG